MMIISAAADMIKAGATQTKKSLLKQYAAGECADLLVDYDFQQEPSLKLGLDILLDGVLVTVFVLQSFQCFNDP